MRINSKHFRMRPGEAVKRKERPNIEQSALNLNQIKGGQNANSTQ
jgi:hypothetical protein